jgi:uncharacterized Zn finger protein
MTCCVLLTCCGALEATGASVNHHGASSVVRLSREFKVKPGQQVTVKGTKLRIKFVAVENDSRCPQGVTCVWAGNAAVKFQVSYGKDSKTVTLNSSSVSSFPGEVEYRGYKIRLINLSPYPQNNRTVPPGGHTATLLVTKG